MVAPLPLLFHTLSAYWVSDPPSHSHIHPELPHLLDNASIQKKWTSLAISPAHIWLPRLFPRPLFLTPPRTDEKMRALVSELSPSLVLLFNWSFIGDNQFISTSAPGCIDLLSQRKVKCTVPLPPCWKPQALMPAMDISFNLIFFTFCFFLLYFLLWFKAKLAFEALSGLSHISSRMVTEAYLWAVRGH